MHCILRKRFPNAPEVLPEQAGEAAASGDTQSYIRV